MYRLATVHGVTERRTNRQSARWHFMKLWCQ